jgi:hypothetical protein
MSITGVPSIASNGPILSRFPAISRTVTRCNPIGLGRSGDRVANTPVKGWLLSERGCVFKMLRWLLCNHVSKIISSPAVMPCNPSATSGITSSHASGPPSEPCRGASARRFKTERIDPIELTRIFLRTGSTLVVDFTTANRFDVAAENNEAVARIKLAGEPGARCLAKSYLIRSDTLKKFHSQVLPLVWRKSLAPNRTIIVPRVPTKHHNDRFSLEGIFAKQMSDAIFK